MLRVRVCINNVNLYYVQILQHFTHPIKSLTCSKNAVGPAYWVGIV